jgi:8-oxo-dGTP pyrophosphatase MutT (NUDIX family)
MAISSQHISDALAGYLQRHPEDADPLSSALRLLSGAPDVTSRRAFPMHATAGALLVRGDHILLVRHRAYEILLQPGGHLEPADVTLADAAQRELVEETGIDPASVVLTSSSPVYVEYDKVPARPDKNEPDHFHLDFGYSFATTAGDVGRIQESEVTDATWYPLAEAKRLVGHRIGRVTGSEPIGPR